MILTHWFNCILSENVFDISKEKCSDLLIILDIYNVSLYLCTETKCFPGDEQDEWRKTNYSQPENQPMKSAIFYHQESPPHPSLPASGDRPLYRNPPPVDTLAVHWSPSIGQHINTLLFNDYIYYFLIIVCFLNSLVISHFFMKEKCFVICNFWIIDEKNLAWDYHYISESHCICKIF